MRSLHDFKVSRYYTQVFKITTKSPDHPQTSRPWRTGSPSACPSVATIPKSSSSTGRCAPRCPHPAFDRPPTTVITIMAARATVFSLSIMLIPFPHASDSAECTARGRWAEWSVRLNILSEDLNHSCSPISKTVMNAITATEQLLNPCCDVVQVEQRLKNPSR